MKLCCNALKHFSEWDDADDMNIVEYFYYCPYCGTKLEEDNKK